MDQRTILFFHAHPDDEAIFTGATIALLKEAGHRIIVAYATDGALGEPLPDGSDLVVRRAQEARAAAEILGVDSVEFLGYVDSGMNGENTHEHAFVHSDVNEAVRRLCEIITRENATAIFIDDENGAYGHADHVHAHKVGEAAARVSQLQEIYLHTFDREYLHFVDTHLVEGANDARVEMATEHADAQQVANIPIGMSSVEITHTVNGADVIKKKREAMLAHSSQVPADSSTATMDDTPFTASYGYEWFCARGSQATLLNGLTI